MRMSKIINNSKDYFVIYKGKDNKVAGIAYAGKNYLPDQSGYDLLISDYFANNSSLSTKEITDKFNQDLNDSMVVKLSKTAALLKTTSAKIATLTMGSVLTLTGTMAGISGCDTEEDQNLSMENSFVQEQSEEENLIPQELSLKIYDADDLEGKTWEELIVLLESQEDRDRFEVIRQAQQNFNEAAVTIMKDYDGANQLYLTGKEVMALYIKANLTNHDVKEFVNILGKYNFSTAEEFLTTYHQAQRVIGEFASYAPVPSGLDVLFENQEDKDIINKFEELKIKWQQDRSTTNRDAMVDFIKNIVYENNTTSLLPTGINALAFLKDGMIPFTADLGNNEDRLFTSTLLDLLDSNYYPNTYYRTATTESGLIELFDGEETCSDEDIAKIINILSNLDNRFLEDSTEEIAIKDMLKSNKDVFKLFETLTIKNNSSHDLSKTMLTALETVFNSQLMDNYAYDYHDSLYYIASRILPIWEEQGIISHEKCLSTVESTYGACEYNFEQQVEKICNYAEMSREYNDDAYENSDALVKSYLIKNLDVLVEDLDRNINVEERQMEETFGNNYTIGADGTIYDGTEGQIIKVETGEVVNIPITEEEAKEEFTQEEIEQAQEEAQDKFEEEYHDKNVAQQEWANGYSAARNIVYRPIFFEVSDNGTPTTATEDYIDYIFGRFASEISAAKSGKSASYQAGVDDGIRAAVKAAIADGLESYQARQEYPDQAGPSDIIEESFPEKDNSNNNSSHEESSSSKPEDSNSNSSVEDSSNSSIDDGNNSRPTDDSSSNSRPGNSEESSKPENSTGNSKPEDSSSNSKPENSGQDSKPEESQGEESSYPEVLPPDQIPQEDSDFMPDEPVIDEEPIIQEDIDKTSSVPENSTPPASNSDNSGAASIPEDTDDWMELPVEDFEQGPIVEEDELTQEEIEALENGVQTASVTRTRRL